MTSFPSTLTCKEWCRFRISKESGLTECWNNLPLPRGNYWTRIQNANRQPYQENQEFKRYIKKQSDT